jgi:hypothetical protein
MASGKALFASAILGLYPRGGSSSAKYGKPE